MQIPQIRLQSTFAQTQIQTTPARLEMEKSKAELSIEQPQARMEVSHTPSKLTIDQTEAWAQLSFKSIPRLVEDAKHEGYQAWFEGVARVSQEGDELMKIENGGSPIPEQARRNSEPASYEFNIGWIPSQGSVKIDYKASKIDIDWKVNKPIISSNVTKQEVYQYSPGKVDISLKNHASLKIDFENLKFVGTNYEQSI